MIFAVIYRSADGLTAALWVYIMTFFWGRNTDEVALLSAVNLVGALCAMAIIPLLTRRFDKRNIAIFVTLCSILTGGGSAVARMLGWIPEGVVFPVLVAQSALDTAMVVTVSTLLGSMISDTVEDLQKESGLRREGAVVAGQTFVNKVAIASGAWAAGLVLTLIQFPRVGQDQEVSEVKIFLLGAVYVAVIACAYLGAAVALRRYAIDRNAHARNVEAVSAMEGVG
jgi:Na+/melibiose symporter-like transporter